MIIDLNSDALGRAQANNVGSGVFPLHLCIVEGIETLDPRRHSVRSVESDVSVVGTSAVTASGS